MFSSNKKEMIEEKKDATSAMSASVILADTEIIGDIKSSSNLRVDGKVKGNLTVSGRLVIGVKGAIEGQVICSDATIEGAFQGDITAHESLSIKEKGSVVGKIITKLFSVTPGAKIKGTVEAEVPEPKAAAPLQKDANK